MNIALKREKTAAEAALTDQFAKAPRSANAARAFQRFETLGLPGRRVESWHYTDLRAQLKEAAPLAAAPHEEAIAAARALLAAEPKLAATRLVLIDGRLIAELSDAPPAGVALTTGAPDGAIAENVDALIALAAAIATGGFTLSVNAGVDAGRLEIVHLSREGASFARLRIDLGAGARAALVERCLGAALGAQRHRLTEITLAKGARLDQVVSLEDSPRLNLDSTIAQLAEGAELFNFGLALGGELTRRQLFVSIDGPNAQLSLAGLTLLDGERRSDTTIEARHGAPRGTSREFFRTIVADEAAGTFQGKITVAPHAQKTDGAMKSQAILLSPTATMNNKPELEIFADDVVCGHGATVGALDPQQVFYLEARGIPRDEAEAILLEAFGAEAIGRIADAEIAEAVATRARAWFAGRGMRR